MENENEFDYDTVTLYDENEQETEFAIIDGIEYNGKTYLALVEAAHVNDEECEFIILRQDRENGEEVLVTIQDEDEFQEVMNLFDEKLDDFELTEEDDEDENDGE